MLRSSQIWSTSAPSFRLPFMFFAIFLSIFEHFLTFWHKHKNVPSLSYTFPPRALESRALLFCFVLLLLLLLLYYFIENGILKNVHQVCSMLLQGNCSQAFSIKRARQHISPYMYVYTHVYAHIHHERHEITDMSNSSLTHHGVCFSASPLSRLELLSLGEKPSPRPQQTPFVDRCPM